MKAYIRLAFTLSATWLLLSFHFTPLLLSFGALSVLLVLFVVHRMRVVDRERWPPGFSTWRILGYLPWLTAEVVRSNLHVARRILRRRVDVEPSLILVPAPQSTALAKVIYANSITLTPGTVSVVVDEEDGTILVHALTEASAQGLETGEMGRRVGRLEGG